jgi:hypothetical protein
MGTIFERSNGSYAARVRMRGYDPESSTFPTRKAAADWISAIESDIRRGKHRQTTGEGLSVAEALDQ